METWWNRHWPGFKVEKWGPKFPIDFGLNPSEVFAFSFWHKKAPVGLGFMLHKNYNIFSNKKGFSHDIRWVSLRGKMTASVLENWGIMFFWNASLHDIMLYKATWNNTKQVAHLFTMLGGYQNFLILVGFNFHKIIYRRFWFHFSLKKEIRHWSRVSIFWKIGSFFTMLILVNMKTTS